MYHREWGRAADGPMVQCVPLGEAVFALWDSAAEVLESARALGRSLVARGHAVLHLPGLEAGIDKLQRNRARAYDNWPWFRPEHAASHLAPPVPQQATADLIPSGDLGNARTRLLGLRHDPKLFLEAPTAPPLNPGDDLHLAGCL